MIVLGRQRLGDQLPGSLEVIDRATVREVVSVDGSSGFQVGGRIEIQAATAE
jgi:hypothetical protein